MAEAFLKAAMAGQDKEALRLANPGSALQHQLADFRKLGGADALAVVSVHAGKAVALAVTTNVVSDRGRKGPLMLRLIRRQDRWLVTDVDLESADDAQGNLKKFLKDHPDATLVPEPSHQWFTMSGPLSRLAPPGGFSSNRVSRPSMS